MNKKLPNVYHNNNPINTNNKNVFISYQETKNINEKKVTNKIEKELEKKYINFFEYFNKKVEITLLNDEIILTKILSKKDNKILLSNGTYLNLDDIKMIN